MTDVEIINARLSEAYRTLENVVVYRVIWSEDIFENRLGEFNVFTESGIFLRREFGVRKVRKYNYIHNRWIFEVFAPGNVTRNPETPDAENGDYIPVYVFEAGNGMYLPPTMKVVEFLIACLEGKVKKDDLPTDEYLQDREIQAIEESLDDHPNWFQTRPGDTRNAVFIKPVKEEDISEPELHSDKPGPLQDM